MYLPPRFSGENTPRSSVFVLLDPVKSAEPPTVSFIIGLTIFKTNSEDFRVAIEGLFSETSFFKSLNFFCKDFGRFPLKTRLNSSCFLIDNCLKVFDQFVNSRFPLLPIFSQADFISFGISNAGYFQP